jgi:predicted Zn-dependent peptidase
MNRSLAPEISLIESFEYLKAERLAQIQQLPTFYIGGSEEAVVKVELLFEGGYQYQTKPLQASAVNALLLEGSKGKSAKAIAEFFENRGAFLDTSLHADYASVQLHCLSRQLEELLPYLLELLQTATFPEEELEDWLHRKKQKFAINQEKVSYLAKNAFVDAFFGAGHPYNNAVNAESFDSLTQADLFAFYEQQYQKKPFTVLLSGQLSEAQLKSTAQHLAQYDFGAANQAKLTFPELKANKELLQVEKAGATQSAIKMGKPMPNKGHADFPALFFANTILGGYFGSRLMSNLREDKGYTYGIGSGLIANRAMAYFVLSTEVGAEHTLPALVEIEKEMRRLAEEPIAADELETVKQYLQGSLMRNFDGPFAAMDRFKSLYVLGLDYAYYDSLIHDFKAMTAERLLQTFQQYYQFNDLSKVVAGKKS